MPITHRAPAAHLLNPPVASVLSWIQRVYKAIGYGVGAVAVSSGVVGQRGMSGGS